jgi:hypothetical protein
MLVNQSKQFWPPPHPLGLGAIPGGGKYPRVAHSFDENVGRYF